jgi:dihydropyrimidinase
VSYDLVIRSARIVVDGQGVLEGDLAVADGRIAALGASLPAGCAAEEFDARGLVILPGAVDTHTHWGYRNAFDDDARTDGRAAVLGGTTTAHVMHRVPPGELAHLRDLAVASTSLDFVLTPAVYDEATAAEIPRAIEEFGVRAFKFYLAYKPSPVSQPGDDWNQLTDGLMLEALEVIARYPGTVAFVHAENAEIVAHGIARTRAAGGSGIAAWEEANPSIAEAEAMQRAAVMCERAGVPLYFVHLSGEDALAMLHRVRRDLPDVRAETCPHYLFHNVARASDAVKFSPPIRHAADNEALWRAVADGTIDCIGSDNTSTCSPAKTGEVWSITRGGPSAGVLLPLVLSEGVARGRIDLVRAAQVTATNAAKVLGLHPAKGAIRIGADADLAIVDLDRERTVSPEALGVASDYTLYDDVVLRGWPVATLVRGAFVAREHELVGAPPGGPQHLARRGSPVAGEGTRSGR